MLHGEGQVGQVGWSADRSQPALDERVEHGAFDSGWINTLCQDSAPIWSSLMTYGEMSVYPPDCKDKLRLELEGKCTLIHERNATEKIGENKERELQCWASLFGLNTRITQTLCVSLLEVIKLSGCMWWINSGINKWINSNVVKLALLVVKFDSRWV